MPLPRVRSRRGQPGPVDADPGRPWWQAVEPLILCETVGGGASEQRTSVRTLWDDETWRVLFELEDTRPWSTLTEHDAPLWTEEVVEVFIDPVGDLAGYFEVEINPAGAVVDVVLRRVASGWRKDFGWHVDGLRRHARLTPTGWAAELAIPFEALGAPVPSPGTCWRVNFYRIDRPGGPGTESRLDAWSPTGVRNFHRPASFGTLEFVA